MVWAAGLFTLVLKHRGEFEAHKNVGHGDFDYVGPEWYGMWSARPLLILEQCAFDSLKSPIPLNYDHWGEREERSPARNGRRGRCGAAVAPPRPSGSLISTTRVRSGNGQTLSTDRLSLSLSRSLARSLSRSLSLFSLLDDLLTGGEVRNGSTAALYLGRWPWRWYAVHLHQVARLLQER